MVRASDKLAVLSAEAPINSPVQTDGAAFIQLQEEMRSAFECTVIDLPRSMLVQYPQLTADVQITVITTELTLASARDTIRILSWMKSNAPHVQIHVLANKVHPAAQLEISRKDFESSIERKIDILMPFDQKLAAQAAKLGKPIAEVGKASKTIAPLIDLATLVAGVALDADGMVTATPPSRKGTSLIGKFGGLRAIMKKKTPAK